MRGACVGLGVILESRTSAAMSLTGTSVPCILTPRRGWLHPASVRARSFTSRFPNRVPNPLPSDVQSALDAGQKIEAIRRLQDATGLGLRAAREAVEAGALPGGPPAPVRGGDLPRDVERALDDGHLIRAMQLLRDSTNLSSEEAKRRIAASPHYPGRNRANETNGPAAGASAVGRARVRFLVLIVVVGALMAWLLASGS